jgi:parallel beta-helix repeat protein
LARASLVLTGALGLWLAAPAPAGAACNLWASPIGSNRGDGSARAPLRSITQMMFRLSPGQTGCLAAGMTFREAAQITRGGVPGRPVRLLGNGAMLQGGVAVRANDVVVGGVRIHGVGERRAGVVVVQGARVSILRNEIVGHQIVKSTPCVLVEGADGATIDGNVIAHCTKVTSRRIASQGILVRSSSGTTIADNVVARTSGEGIALTNARRTVIVRNQVHGNTDGVYLGPGAIETVVVDNVIAYSGRYNVHGGGGASNLVTANCLWRGFRGNVAGGGFAAVANLVRSPRYVNRFRSFAMRPGPCNAKRPSSRRSAAASVGTAFPVMPRVRLHYRLLGLPRRVKVVGLSVSRVVPGAVLAVRCIRGCRLSDRRVASGTGRSVLAGLRGRWLARGALVELRAERPGWVGHVVRIRVVGSPRGVRVAHLCTAPGPSKPTACNWFARG